MKIKSSGTRMRICTISEGDRRAWKFAETEAIDGQVRTRARLNQKINESNLN